MINCMDWLFVAGLLQSRERDQAKSLQQSCDVGNQFRATVGSDTLSLKG